MVDMKAPLPKGYKVQFFHAVDPAEKKSKLALPAQHSGERPWLAQSHGWLDGTLQAEFNPAMLDPQNQMTWPLVAPQPDIRFVDRTGKSKRPGTATMQPQHVLLIREPCTKPPLLSLVFVRWGGANSNEKDEPEANDGDWGQYGSPPSDPYIKSVVDEAIMQHPLLMSEGGPQHDFEIFSLYVASSKDCLGIIPSATWLAKLLKGIKKTCWWMLWPAEWEDTGDPDFACYIERQALFAAMRACESAGIRSGFPHPADQFELITSKSWMATLSLHPGARLPAATLVSKEAIVIDVQEAAKQALAALERIRSISPFSVGLDDPPAPSSINKDGVKKGVVKLGWSWENRFVTHFEGLKQLQTKLKEITSIAGWTGSQCIVQEWVDFDFEMRLYFLPPGDWEPTATLEPKRIECNEWGEPDDTGTLGESRASFRKLSEEVVLKQRWEEDREAWESAKQQAIQVSQLLIAWLCSANARVVPMIRLDFMLKRLGPGKARVVFGEYCEMGACCLGWKEGPPTIWCAALDNVLR